jgi:hypothetical protein
VNVDAESFRARSPLPQYPRCGEVARLNILMFGDYNWIGTRTEQQEEHFKEWLHDIGNDRLVVIECGAGKAIPTVRRAGEALQSHIGASLVRINKREPDGPAGTISIGSSGVDDDVSEDELGSTTNPGALQALQLIKSALEERV